MAGSQAECSEAPCCQNWHAHFHELKDSQQESMQNLDLLGH